jgi:hypothetical protein
LAGLRDRSFCFLGGRASGSYKIITLISSVQRFAIASGRA